MGNEGGSNLAEGSFSCLSLGDLTRIGDRAVGLGISKIWVFDGGANRLIVKFNSVATGIGVDVLGFRIVG